jgi:hypothetical protein
MKVFFGGSRKWLAQAPIQKVVEGLPDGTVVITGGAPGVDNIAADCARSRGLEVREYPALAHGRTWPSAGPLRNQEMLDKEHPSFDGDFIDIAYLFHSDPGLGKGTKDMKRRLDDAAPAIEVVVTIASGR